MHRIFFLYSICSWPSLFLTQLVILCHHRPCIQLVTPRWNGYASYHSSLHSLRGWKNIPCPTSDRCLAYSRYHSMDASSSKELGLPEYWNRCYESNSTGGKSSHEWFRTFEKLRPFLETKLPPSSLEPRILHLGCGDSVRKLLLVDNKSRSWKYSSSIDADSRFVWSTLHRAAICGFFGDSYRTYASQTSRTQMACRGRAKT